MRDGPFRLTVLVSGGGSNLQAIMDRCSDGRLPAEVTRVISDRADAFGLQRANAAGIATEVLRSADFGSRSAYDEALAARMIASAPDLVILAGFMRILGPEAVQPLAGRMLNIHPALLPAYPGLHTYRRVLAAGERWHGSSVHYVTEELDAGPLIAQVRVAIRPQDDEAALSARVQAAEHRLYPLVIGLIASGRVAWHHGEPRLDGEPLTRPMVFDEEFQLQVTDPR